VGNGGSKWEKSVSKARKITDNPGKLYPPSGKLQQNTPGKLNTPNLPAGTDTPNTQQPSKGGLMDKAGPT